MNEPGGTGLGLVARALVVLLPAAHVVTAPVGGALASGADALVALAVLTGAALLVAQGFPPFRPAIDAPFLLLLTFAAYAGASALWSPTPAYALAKGAGYVGLGLAAWLVARSGSPVGRVMDAWLAGTALALGLTGAGVALLLAFGGLVPGRFCPRGPRPGGAFLSSPRGIGPIRGTARPLTFRPPFGMFGARIVRIRVGPHGRLRCRYSIG